MSTESPPSWTQNGSFPAEQTRRAVTSLLARGSNVGSIVGGLVGSSDLQVTTGGGMSVNVAPGECWVPGTSSSTQGGYYCRVSSSTNLPVAASDPTNPRVDSVTATVTDKAYSGAADSFVVQVNTGTPTSGATLSNLNGAPALPASSLLIAYVLVPAGSSSVTSGNILSKAATFSLSGAPQLVTALPASPVDGQEIDLLVDASNGVRWRLRYRAASSSSYKWEAVGAPMSARVSTTETTTSGTFTDLATVGPSVVLPAGVGGDFLARYGFTGFSSASGQPAQMGIKVGSATITSANSVIQRQASYEVSVAGETLLAAVAAGSTLKGQYLVGGGATGTFWNRFLSIVPVRVG